MTDDLTARLERALHVQEQHERDLQPDAATLADLHARVARVRRGRTVSYAAVAAASIGVLTVAGWFGLQDRTPEPAQTPTPSVTSTPTPQPTPSAQADAEPPVPVQLPGLPPMLQAPDGILDATGPGWFVASYASGLLEPPEGDARRVTLALSAPTGELYHLTDVATSGIQVVRWTDAGTVRAVVWDDEGGPRGAWVDLRSGEVTLDERMPEGGTWLGMSGDDELWSPPWTMPGATGVVVLPPQGDARPVDSAVSQNQSVSPDGRTVVGETSDARTVAVDLATGQDTELVVPAGQRCVVVGWYDATGVLAACTDEQTSDSVWPWYWDEHGGQMVRLDTAGGAPRTLAPIRGDQPVPWQGERVRDGVLVTIGAPLVSSSGEDCFDFCYGGAYLWSDGTAVPVPLEQDENRVCEVAAGRSGLLLRTGDQCYEMTTGDQWWLVDEATGAARSIAPAVESELGMGARSVVERS